MNIFKKIFIVFNIFVSFFFVTHLSFVKAVDRSDRLIMTMDHQKVPDPTNWNYFAPNANTSAGGHQGILEYLFYFNLETGELLPWLGKSFKYNKDFTELIVNLRNDAYWNDGNPFSADDVVFTINMLINGPDTLSWGPRIKDSVKEIIKINNSTVKFVLNKADPLFANQKLIVEIWGALPVVPKHIWSKVDPATFKNYDPNGDPKVIGSGPYLLESAKTDQIILKRDDNWWGAKTGFKPLPQPKQIVWIGGTEESRAALMASGQLDSGGYISRGTFEVINKQNPNVKAWHNSLPFAWMEPVPLYLGINNLNPPWDDPEMRWALNHALDRKEMALIAWEGIATPVRSIFAETAPLLKFVSDNEDLFKKYPLEEFNLDKTAKILKAKGYTREGKGFWKDSNGNTIKVKVDAAAPWVEQKKLGLIIGEQLIRAGFDSSVRVMEAAHWNEMYKTGESDVWPHWIVASADNPYPYLDWYHSKWFTPNGKSAQGLASHRWKNKEFDMILDKMSVLTTKDDKFWKYGRQALEIYMKEIPTIPTTSQPALLPYDHTYWTNWPTADNNWIQPYYQCGTALPMIVGIKKAK